MEIVSLVVVALGTGGFWWYRRRKRQRAQEPKCPVCRSRNLEGVSGEIGSGTAVLGDEYQCLECGLDPAELDEEARDRVEALQGLQRAEFPLAELWGKGVMLVLRKSRSSVTGTPRSTDNAERKLTDVWQTMNRVCDEHPEAFEVPVSERADQTAGELLSERMLEDEGGMGMESFFDLAALKRVFEQRRSAERTLETVREALAADVQQRRSESW